MSKGLVGDGQRALVEYSDFWKDGRNVFSVFLCKKDSSGLEL